MDIIKDEQTKSEICEDLEALKKVQEKLFAYADDVEALFKKT